MADDWEMRRQLQDQRQRYLDQREQRKENARQLVEQGRNEARREVATINAETTVELAKIKHDNAKVDRILDLEALAMRLFIQRQDEAVQHGQDIAHAREVVKGRILEIIALAKTKKRQTQLEHENAVQLEFVKLENTKDLERVRLELAKEFSSMTEEEANRARKIFNEMVDNGELQPDRPNEPAGVNTVDGWVTHPPPKPAEDCGSARNQPDRDRSQDDLTNVIDLMERLGSDARADEPGPTDTDSD